MALLTKTDAEKLWANRYCNKREKGAVSAPQVYFIFCGIAAKCFINPPPGYAAKFTDLYGLLQTGE